MKRRNPSADAQFPRKKARQNTSQLAQTQAIVRRELKKRIDWKYTDHSQSVTNVTSTGAITSLLANLTRGDLGKDNFGGNHVIPQAITLKYYMTTNQNYNSCRLMVFQWFDSATPAVTGIIESNSLHVGTISPTLITNKSYIKVLYDQTHLMAPTAMDGAGNVGGNGLIQPVKVYIPGKKLKPIRYNSGTNVVQDGNLYVLIISDDSLTSYPLVTWYSRVTFSDND